MTRLAPLLEEFFTDRLINQRHVSPNTIAAYRDTFRLLVVFTHDTLGTQPCDLDLADLDTVMGFDGDAPRASRVAARVVADGLAVEGAGVLRLP